MKYLFVALFFICRMCLHAQEKPEEMMEAQIETAIENTDENVDDDSYWQSLEFYKRRHLNLNYATENDLIELHLLSRPQIESFLSYRKLAGNLISIYELQAVPLWDIYLIKSLLPYITVMDNRGEFISFGKRFAGGSNTLLFRYGKIAEQAKGYKTPEREEASHYLGSRDRFFVRYKYNYNNLLQYGMLGAKDAGEEFFKGSQKNGFDFYSFHFFARNIGIIKQLALGDFTVNMGQGLIQWQSLAFGKSSSVLNVKREAAFLRPYNSSGPYNFHRGIAVAIEKKNWSAGMFASYRDLSGNIVSDSAGEDHISSFQTSGYHRTNAELSDKNSMRQMAGGAMLKFRKDNWHITLNTVVYNFSRSFHKDDKPYNLFALNATNWNNSSVDYSYTYRNIHLFGEAAFDKKMNKAFVNGLLISMGAFADAALVYRAVGKAYQALYANAFTENSFPGNERGMYVGISLKPSTFIRIDLSADVFSFPWLKYLVDAPSGGRDYLLQCTYAPNRRSSLSILYKSKAKQKSFAEPGNVAKGLIIIPQNNLRLQSSLQLSAKCRLSNRVETMWYDNNGSYNEHGFLMYVQCDYKHSAKLSGNVRLQHFETDGYNSRLYAYESDMLYNYSVPQFFDKGFHYYVNGKIDLTSMFGMGRKSKFDMSCWIKWNQTIYNNKEIIGSGLDVISGSKKSELKAQLIMGF